MPINRAPFNALVDDDGSNTVGSIWNKAQIKDVILDPVDAALVSAVSPFATLVQTSVTGTQHDWVLAGRGRITTVEWLGASDLTVTGIAGGVAGDIVTFRNTTDATGTRRVATFLPTNLGAGSAGANRFTNYSTSAGTPVGPGGTITYVYDGGIWLLSAHDQGAWIAAPYSGAAFTASAGSWTVAAGSVTALRYKLAGKTLTVMFTLVATTITVATADLRIGNAMYGGFTVGFETYNALAQGYLAPTSFPGMISTVAAGSALLKLLKSDSSTWATTTNNGYFYGQITFEVL